MQWIEGRLAATRSIAGYLTTYPADYAIAQTGWISTALDVAPTTFATALGEAFRDVHSLPPARTRTGDLLRAAADAAPAAVSKRETTLDPAWTPTVSL